MKDRVEQDELDFDTQRGRWAKSIFDHFEPVPDIEPEPNIEPEPKREDGTFKRNPSLEEYRNGAKFK